MSEIDPSACPEGAGVARDRPGGHLLGFLSVMAVAVALRAYRLTSWPFDQDELYTLRDSIDPLGQIAAGAGPVGRPLYYVLQHAVLQLAPPSPLTLRAPAVLFGVLGVWLTWRLAHRMFGPTAAWVAALLIAVSPWHLYASHFARYWTLVYVLAACVYLALPRAVDLDRPSGYVTVLLLLAAGALTHPTFLFPMPCAILAFHLFSRDGTFGPVWPSRRAWTWLWGPVLGALVVGFAALLVLGRLSILMNFSGRGLTATVRLVPAIVQWMTPVVAAAAAAGAILLLGRSAGGARRSAAMAAGGMLSAVVLLLAASFQTNVYADYAMAALPLAFVTVGGLVQHLADLLPRRRALAAGIAAVLVVAVLPSTASHLSDGTRFDYRPAYAHILATGGSELVLGWPQVQQTQYGPDLEFREIRGTVQQLENHLDRTAGFWLVTSHRRRGMILGSPAMERWIWSHCRRQLVTERPRLDYRTYRVEVHWCGQRQPARG